jgi:polyphosphate glucokinase
MNILGIDIGGSGIKGAPVDTVTGVLLAERQRIETPEGARPKAVAAVVGELARRFNWQGPVGVGFPGVVQNGVVRTAANVHKKWIDTDAAALLGEATGCPVSVINDADAAGLAEMSFGAGRGVPGVVMVITIGTGIGTALFSSGVLVPNTELGHLIIRGKEAEARATDAVRQAQGLSWKKWAGRFNEYLLELHRLLWPDMFILGGGASKDFEKYAEYLSVPVMIVPAALLNEAGIVGAALAARGSE